MCIISGFHLLSWNKQLKYATIAKKAFIKVLSYFNNPCMQSEDIRQGAEISITFMKASFSKNRYSYLNNLGANSLRARRQVNHS